MSHVAGVTDDCVISPSKLVDVCTAACIGAVGIAVNACLRRRNTLRRHVHKGTTVLPSSRLET